MCEELIYQLKKCLILINTSLFFYILLFLFTYCTPSAYTSYCTYHLRNNCNLSYLWFFYCGCVSITHGTDVKPLFPLHITLSEKLLHDPVYPLLVHLKWFCWVTEIRTMYHVLEHLFNNSPKLIIDASIQQSWKT